MTPTEVYAAILTRLYTTWATATPIAGLNRSYDAPGGPWIEPVIVMGDTYPGELGVDGVGLRTGVFQVNINVLPDGGYRTAMEYAGRLETAFRRAEADDVIFDDPSTSVVGIVDGYYRVMVRINFHAWIGE
jgi:hypothetical protein